MLADIDTVENSASRANSDRGATGNNDMLFVTVSYGSGDSCSFLVLGNRRVLSLVALSQEVKYIRGVSDTDTVTLLQDIALFKRVISIRCQNDMINNIDTDQFACILESGCDLFVRP